MDAYEHDLLERVFTILCQQPQPRRRPKGPDGKYTEACETCVCWEKQPLDLTQDPSGYCWAGRPSATAVLVPVMQKGQDGKNVQGIQPMPFSMFPGTSNASAWCMGYVRDTEAKPDLMEKLAKDVKKRAEAAEKFPVCPICHSDSHAPGDNENCIPF